MCKTQVFSIEDFDLNQEQERVQCGLPSLARQV